MAWERPGGQKPGRLERTLLKVDGGAAVAGVRVWVASQKGTATFRVFTCIDGDGTGAVQVGADQSPAKGEWASVLVPAPAGYVLVRQASNTDGDDLVVAVANVA